MLKKKLSYLIAKLDQLVEQQLCAIVQNSQFVQLQSSWYGVKYLTKEIRNKPSVKLKILNVSWLELSKDLNRTDAEYTRLFDKIYNSEFGQAGGEPYGLLLGDYFLDLHSNKSKHAIYNIRALHTLAEISCMSFVPFVTSVDVKFFGLNEFTDLARSFNISRVVRFASPLLWRKLRQNDISRFIGFVVPRVMLHKDRDNVVWGNAGYAFAAVIANTFHHSGWFLDSIGVSESHICNGIVPNLMASTFCEGKFYSTYQYLTDAMITEAQEKKLNEAGFICLSQIWQNPQAAFFNAPSIKQVCSASKASVYNNRTGTLLSYILCVCRFAHYLKIIAREILGQCQTAREYENFLQEWINEYVATNADAPSEIKIKYPLEKASIKVKTQPGMSDHYMCSIDLCPHTNTSGLQMGIVLNAKVAF